MIDLILKESLPRAVKYVSRDKTRGDIQKVFVSWNADSKFLDIVATDGSFLYFDRWGGIISGVKTFETLFDKGVKISELTEIPLFSKPIKFPDYNSFSRNCDRMRGGILRVPFKTLELIWQVNNSVGGAAPKKAPFIKLRHAPGSISFSLERSDIPVISCSGEIPMEDANSYLSIGFDSSRLGQALKDIRDAFFFCLDDMKSLRSFKKTPKEHLNWKYNGKRVVNTLKLYKENTMGRSRELSIFVSPVILFEEK